MTRKPSTRGAVTRLLSLPPDRDLPDRWAKGGRVPADEAELSPWERIYRTLLRHLRLDPAQTLDAVLHMRRVAGRNPDPADAARLARLEGHALSAVGRVAEACDAYAAAHAAFRKAGERLEAGKAAIGWVHALALRGEPKRAHAVARGAVGDLRGGPPELRGRLESNVGNAWLFTGKYDLATERYRAALAIFRRSGNAWDAGVCAYNLGIIAMMTARVSIARREFLRAREQFRGAGVQLLESYAETGLAALDIAEGNWDIGVKAVGRLRQRFAKLGDERAVAWLHRELAMLFASVGAPEAAQPESAAALSVFDGLGMESEAAQAAFLHGRLLATTATHQEAMVHLERARLYWKKVGNVWSRRRAELEIARVLLEGGHPERALHHLRGIQRYLDRRDPLGDGALCRGVAAEAHLLAGRPGIAATLAKKAHRAARHHPGRLERPLMAGVAARALGALGRSREAVRWAGRSVQDLETLLMRFGTRRLRILTGGARDRIYAEAVEVVLEHGGPSAAARAVDLVAKARSPNLIEDLLHGDARKLRPETRTAIARLRDECLSEGEAPGGEDTRFRALRGEMARLEVELGEGPLRPPALVRRAWEKRAFRQWKGLLHGRELVIYDRGTSGWRAFVVRSGGRVEHVALPDAEDALRGTWIPLRITLETAAHAPVRRRAEFLDRTLDDCTRSVEQLRSALWTPLSLASRDVVVVPHGDLHSVPVQALPVSNGDGPPCVSRLPHPALLGSRRRKVRPSALLLGGGETGTRKEVREVGTILRRSGFDVTVSGRRDSLGDGSGRLGVLHVAAHGVFHRQGWLFSGLRLADGWLGFEQLHRRRLQDSLLHFTSCESGLAENMPGSDMDGWITAGLGAGARELVLTLWKVDDASSRAFASAFYPAWVGGAPAAEAAALARDAVRATMPHPFHWGPFAAVSG
ncbi:MAG: CHAT domain-containing protein [Gemmatimonadota bacterium]|nr:CHAT domain-containing protein [Gemmatimonadota bacterium]